MVIAILTNFHFFNPGYSLTGIVIDQARMLARHGHKVHVVVREQFETDSIEYMHEKLSSEGVDLGVEIHEKIKKTNLKDYMSMLEWSEDHQFYSIQTGEDLIELFDECKVDIAFTHDWVFTGWNLPYAGAIRYASMNRPHIGWMHWVHSLPTAGRDWWNFSVYGPQHKIVFPNKTDLPIVCGGFRTHSENVLAIPHIKDPRTWFEMSKETCSLIDKYPHIMDAELVQVYPCGTDRLMAKGITHLIGIFSHFKKTFKKDVCLILANQWATGRSRKEDIENYKNLAKRSGLDLHKEFIFTSEAEKEYETGVSARILRELQHLSNVFIFPTREESFGLVGPEALMSGVLPVFNKSLSMMSEVYDWNGYYFDFSSFHNNFEPPNGWDEYYEKIAGILIHEYQKERSLILKSLVKRKFNYDTLYNNYYRPIMLALREWAQQTVVPAEIIEEMDRWSNALKEREERKNVSMS